MHECKGCKEDIFSDEEYDFEFCSDECELLYDLHEADVPAELLLRVQQMLELE